MSTSHHFDTVAFDIRDNAAMLFFAKTGNSGDIDNYILLMKGIDEEYEETLCLEIDDTQVSGPGIIERARLDGALLKLSLGREAAARFGSREIVITFDDNEQNRAGIEAGSLRVLGECLEGGHG